MNKNYKILNSCPVCFSESISKLTSGFGDNNVLHKHNEKYQEILNIMKVNKQPVQQKQMSMKDELTAFLNQQNSK